MRSPFIHPQLGQRDNCICYLRSFRDRVRELPPEKATVSELYQHAIDGTLAELEKIQTLHSSVGGGRSQLYDRFSEKIAVFPLAALLSFL